MPQRLFGCTQKAQTHTEFSRKGRGLKGYWEPVGTHGRASALRGESRTQKPQTHTEFNFHSKAQSLVGHTEKHKIHRTHTHVTLACALWMENTSKAKRISVFREFCVKRKTCLISFNHVDKINRV